MGLSIGSFADALLPITAGSAPTEGGADAGGEFAALLQTVFGNADVESEGEDLFDLPFPAAEEGESQLAAELAGAQLSAQITNLVPELFVFGEPKDSTVTSIDTVLLNLEGESELSDVGLENDLPSASEAAQEVPAEAVNAADRLLEGFELPELPGAGTPSDSQPSTVSSAQADIEMESVVRFVGNADSTNNESQDRQGGNSNQQAAAPLAGVAAAATPDGAFEVAAQEEVATEVAVSSAPASDATEMPPAVRRLEQAVIERIERGGGEAQIRLDPPELGTVLIRVRIDGDAVHVHVEADQQNAAALLRDHTGDLSNLLGDRGLNLADVFVGLGDGSSSQTGGEQQPNARRADANPGDFAAILGIEPEGPSASAAHNRLRSVYNPDGQHVYLV